MSAARSSSEHSSWRIATLVALATLFMLQASRVFVGYLVVVVDQSERVTLAAAAIVVFASPALAWLLVKVSTHENVLVGSATILVTARLILQFWENPTARVLLGAAIIVTWGWLAIVALDRARGDSGVGILLGITGDLIVRMANGAIDLPWMPGTGAHVATIVLACALLYVAYMVQRTRHATQPGSFGLTLPIIAIGPAVAMHHLMTGNLALAHVTSGGSRAMAWCGLLAGIALGFASLAAMGQGDAGHRRTSARITIAVAALLGGVGVWLFWKGEALALVGVVLAPGGMIVLLGAALAGHSSYGLRSRTGRLAAAFTIGLVLQVAVLFAYYTFTGLGAVLPVAWVILTGGALISGGLPVLPGVQSFGRYRFAAPVAVLLVFAVAILPELAASDPEAVDATGPEFTLMVYNIQGGFALDRTWSLKETARAIEAENPDIVVLNEVGRGWPVTSGNDELPWLSRKLGMPYIWGAASGDGLWGNAVLSRFPMSEESVRKFASTHNLKRSATGVRIDLGNEDLWVFGTHLDNPSGAGATRMEQVTELIGFWDNRLPAVVAGDFNAISDDDVLVAMTDAGFEDPGILLDGGLGTSEDHRRIDFILTSSGIEVLDIWVPDTEASDHKPVVARLRIER